MFRYQQQKFGFVKGSLDAITVKKFRSQRVCFDATTEISSSDK